MNHSRSAAWHVEFEAAAIAARLHVFDEQSANGFWRWDKIPSPELASWVYGWRQMGPRAGMAHQECIASYYTNAGRADCLPEGMRTSATTAFDEWRKIAVTHDLVNACASSVRARSQSAALVRFRSELKDAGIAEGGERALFISKGGLHIYFVLLCRPADVRPLLVCNNAAAASPLVDHSGVHAIVPGLEFGRLNSGSGVMPTVAEIRLHVRLFQDSIGQFKGVPD